MKEELQIILDKWAVETIAKMKTKLSDSNKEATGDLIDSLDHKITDDQVIFLMADYGKFVESGSKDHWISEKNNPGVAKKFKTWASIKAPNMVSVYSKIDRNKKGYIHVNKQAPVKFFKSVIEENIEDLILSVEDVVIRYLGDRIQLI